MIKYTEEMKNLIREYYIKYPNPSQKLSEHPLFLAQGIKPGAIDSKARRIGATKRHYVLRPFNEREKQTIRKMAENKSVAEIAARLKNISGGVTRNYNSIVGFMRREGLARKPDEYTLNDLAVAFRCCHQTVVRWVEKGLLKGKKVPFHGGDIAKSTVWRFQPYHVAKFVINHPFELENNHVDVPWLVSLLMEFGNRATKEERE